MGNGEGKSERVREKVREGEKKTKRECEKYI